MDLRHPDIIHFIKENLDKNVHDLALQKPPCHTWDMPAILDQIKARQKLQTKHPTWAENFDLIFPSSFLVEQASSFATAHFKSSIMTGKTFIDLTSGLGIDSFACAPYFKRSTFIDIDPITTGCLKQNSATLFPTNNNITVHTISAEEFIHTAPKTDWIMIDPQRRDTHQKGKFSFTDCSPNILKMLPDLLKTADNILIKASPMLDIHVALEQLPHVKNVYAVAWDKQCKELLFHLSPKPSLTENPLIHAIELQDNGTITSHYTFTYPEEKECTPSFSDPKKYLYDPHPAMMKAGAFNCLCHSFNMTKLHPMTHLYTSDILCADFPGTCFEIKSNRPLTAKSLPSKKVTLMLRHSPFDLKTLRKKLKCTDGNDALFCVTTLHNGKPALLELMPISF